MVCICITSVHSQLQVDSLGYVAVGMTNADIDLKPGATLRIINNGTIETRHGFKVPIGAIVDIKRGKIIN